MIELDNVKHDESVERSEAQGIYSKYKLRIIIMLTSSLIQ